MLKKAQENLIDLLEKKKLWQEKDGELFNGLEEAYCMRVEKRFVLFRTAALPFRTTHCNFSLHCSHPVVISIIFPARYSSHLLLQCFHFSSLVSFISVAIIHRVVLYQCLVKKAGEESSKEIKSGVSLPILGFYLIFFVISISPYPKSCLLLKKKKWFRTVITLGFFETRTVIRVFHLTWSTVRLYRLRQYIQYHILGFFFSVKVNRVYMHKKVNISCGNFLF